MSRFPAWCGAFNEEIRESCTILMPDANEIRELGASKLTSNSATDSG